MHGDTPLLGLKNIGPMIAARFEAVGIKTVADLRAIGPAQAYKRVKAARPGATLPVCYHLYSLQGALDGVHWDAVSPAVKQTLLSDAGLRRPTRRANRRARSGERARKWHHDRPRCRPGIGRLGGRHQRGRRGSAPRVGTRVHRSQARGRRVPRAPRTPGAARRSLHPRLERLCRRHSHQARRRRLDRSSAGAREQSRQPEDRDVLHEPLATVRAGR